MPTIYNFSVRAGNSGTTGNRNGLVIRRSVTGKTFHFLTSDTGTGVISKSIGSGIIVDEAAQQLTVQFTPAETRQIRAAGTPVAYEIEERIGGTEHSFVYGDITGLAGINTDA